MLRYFGLTVVIIVILLSGCASEEKKPATETVSFLLENFESLSIKRTAEPRLFVGNDLWEYINGGAELYHLYGFVEVATADYSADETKMIVDIYAFDTPLNAFGLYSQQRHPDYTQLLLGIEGFLAPPSLTFIKDRYMVRIIYDDNVANEAPVVNLAQEMEKIIPGVDKMPSVFSIFPHNSIAEPIDGSEKYFKDSFLGHKFLAEVFSVEYKTGGEYPQTFFISPDSLGSKFLAWKNYAEQSEQYKELVGEFGFEGSYRFIFKDKFYGDIITGLKNGYLVGIVEYKSSQKNLLENWLQGI